MTKSELVLFGSLALAGCRCGGAERSASTTGEAEPGGLSVWGAHFRLPEGWSGGENDAGGYEYTNGDLALMIGRAPTATSPSLESFFEERVKTLEAQGKLERPKRAEQNVSGKTARTLQADVLTPDGGVLSIRLLVVEPTGAERLSLLMLGEKSREAALAKSFEFMVQSLRFE